MGSGSVNILHPSSFSFLSVVTFLTSSIHRLSPLEGDRKPHRYQGSPISVRVHKGKKKDKTWHTRAISDINTLSRQKPVSWLFLFQSFGLSWPLYRLAFEPFHWGIVTNSRVPEWRLDMQVPGLVLVVWFLRLLTLSVIWKRVKGLTGDSFTMSRSCLHL